MSNNKTKATLLVSKNKSKAGLHSNNRHQGRYPMKALCQVTPKLSEHLITAKNGDLSIDFSNPNSVKLLNKALLAHSYGVHHWDIPQGYLCPPIPGRADYVHRLHELLSRDLDSKDLALNALDVGTGANCIYPIVGASEYRWNCVGSDIDPVSIDNANSIIENNTHLKEHIECRLQVNDRHFFTSIIQPKESYHVTMCNPPFHKSMQDAQQGSQRKVANLSKNRGQGANKSSKTATLNFGGQSNELWCSGGENAFIRNMALESQKFADQVIWFSTLISKKENVRQLKRALEMTSALEMTVVEMNQGQKVSRFAAWTFMDKTQRKAFAASISK
jgi:23S rRNA (adenine1618-N6)-methyltransferase